MRKTASSVALTLAGALALAGCGPEVEVESVSAKSSTPASAQPAATGDTSGPTSTPRGRISDLAAATTENPAGSERGVTGRAKAEVPEGWAESKVDDLFDLRYTAGEADTDPLLSLSGHYGKFRMSRAAASTLIAEIQMGTPGFTIHSQEDIQVPGAGNAVRINFSWGTEEDGGVFDGMWILAVDEANSDTIALALSAGQGELSEQDFDRIANSFQMLPAQQ